MNFDDYLKEQLENDAKLRDAYNVIRKNCFSCLLRHQECGHSPTSDECEHWKLGKCYTCKHYMNNKWFDSCCAVGDTSGCDQYKRSWKETFEWYRFLRQV